MEIPFSLTTIHKNSNIEPSTNTRGAPPPRTGSSSYIYTYTRDIYIQTPVLGRVNPLNQKELNLPGAAAADPNMV
ncbi:hypothetical protein VTJ04DRAFT_2907 [Mycothermus thermophilus]|uniref:uncharacterized protein n=1 Tax=Humicola insolens TaxID=85995 RepID=UPI003744713E